MTANAKQLTGTQEFVLARLEYALQKRAYIARVRDAGYTGDAFEEIDRLLNHALYSLWQDAVRAGVEAEAQEKFDAVQGDKLC